MCSASSEWMIQCWCTSWQICPLPEAVAWQQVIFYEVVKNRIRQVALRQLICNFSQLELALRSLKSKAALDKKTCMVPWHTQQIGMELHAAVCSSCLCQKNSRMWGPKKIFEILREVQKQHGYSMWDSLAPWQLFSLSSELQNSVLATRFLPNRPKVFIVFGLLGKIFG